MSVKLDKPIKIRKQLPTGYGCVIKEPEWMPEYQNDPEPQFYRMNMHGEWECLDGAGTLTARGLAALIYRNLWEDSSMTEFEELLHEHPDRYPSVDPQIIKYAEQRAELKKLGIK